MWWKVTGIVLVLSAVITALITGAQSHWHQKMQQQVQRLHNEVDDREGGAQPRRYQPKRELPGLPEPVQRFFQAVLTPDQPMIRTLTLQQQGEINLSFRNPVWKSFRGVQDIAVQQTAFLWQARVRMAPGLNTLVSDQFYQGQGRLNAEFAGLFTVAEDSGHQDLAEAELMRFLAESAWYPTRLLPSQGVHWQGLDEDSARATLTHGDLSVSLIFHFNEQSLIETVTAEQRYRLSLDGEALYAPWQGRFYHYQQVEGMQLPQRAEVAWQLDQQWFSYWRGEITDWQFRFYPSDIPLSARNW